MKKIIFIIFISFICIGMVGCSKTNEKNNKKLKNEIVLMTNGGVTYNWNYEIGDSSIVIYDDLKSIDKDPGKDGGRVELHYTFRGLSEGKTTIKFSYKNFVDNTISEEKNYDVIVDKDLNVTISERK